MHVCATTRVPVRLMERQAFGTSLCLALSDYPTLHFYYQFCYYSHVQKLQDCTVVLQRSSLPLEKEKWANVLIPDMMSSELDNDEDEDVFVLLSNRSLGIQQL